MDSMNSLQCCQLSSHLMRCETEARLGHHLSRDCVAASHSLCKFLSCLRVYLPELWERGQPRAKPQHFRNTSIFVILLPGIISKISMGMMPFPRLPHNLKKWNWEPENLARIWQCRLYQNSPDSRAALLPVSLPVDPDEFSDRLCELQDCLWACGARNLGNLWKQEVTCSVTHLHQWETLKPSERPSMHDRTRIFVCAQSQTAGRNFWESCRVMREIIAASPGGSWLLTGSRSASSRSDSLISV